MTARTYQRRIAKLRAALEITEWVQPSYNGSPSCSYCGNQQHWGHDAGCFYVTEFGRRKEDVSTTEAGA